LSHEVFFEIVDDQSAVQRPAESTQVLDEGAFLLDRVLSVQAVLDEFLLWVEPVEDEVGVSFMRCSEDDDFKKLRHLLKELDAKWPHLKNAPILIEVD